MTESDIICWKCKYLQLVGSRMINHIGFKKSPIPVHVYYCEKNREYMDDWMDNIMMFTGCEKGVEVRK